MSDTLIPAPMASRKDVTGALPSGTEIEVVLEELEQLIERAKVLYEQYFLGIQRMPPSQLHRKAERLILEFTQHRIRNTALRFRFNTLSPKCGSYNTYWKRTLRQIEQGTYVRHVQRAHRRAMAAGKETPEEMLIGLPKRLREKILRDRDRLAARQEKEDARRAKRAGKAPGEVKKAKPLFHEVDESMLSGDEDMDAMFDAILDSQEEKERAAASKPAASDAEVGFDDIDLDEQFDAILAPGTPAPAPSARGAKQGEQSSTGGAGGGRRAGAWSRQFGTRRVPTQSSGTTGGVRVQPSGTTGGVPRMPSKQELSARHRKGEQAARGTGREGREAGAPTPPGMTAAKSRDLYKRYVQAKKLVGEDVSQVSYDKLMRTLNRQAPKIMQQHKASGVDFNVVIKDDKVVLKAKPLRDK